MRQLWGGIVRISQCQSFYLAWSPLYDPKCEVRFWEEIVFPHWLSLSRELCEYLLGLIFPLHLPLSSLSWFLDVTVVVAAILEDGNVDLLEVNVARMEADRVPLRKAFGNASTVNAVITSPRSAGRNSVDLSGHSYLSLTLLLCVALSGLFIHFLHYSWISHSCTDTGGVWSTSTTRVLSY